MRRRKNLYNMKNSKTYIVFTSIALGILLIIICLMIFSSVMTKIDTPDNLVNVMSSLSLCIGTYVAAYSCAKKKRKGGLISGIIIGALIYCVLIIAGLIFIRIVITLSFLPKLLMILSCGAIGGIVGVNSKSKKY